jgi:hypothetical protein
MYHECGVTIRPDRSDDESEPDETEATSDNGRHQIYPRATRLFGCRRSLNTSDAFIPLLFFINSSAGDSATPIICGRQNQN